MLNELRQNVYRNRPLPWYDPNMFPLKDSRPSGIFPFVTYALIALNLYVLFLEYTTIDFEGFVYQWALVPSSINFGDLSTLYTFITSMFLHAGFFHFISNMWFLYIFGDNVEGDLGYLKFLLFYLAGGAVAALCEYFFMPNSDAVILGASGAVAAVLGYYFVKFPHHTVKTLVTFGFIFFVELSATIVLGSWFIIQLISGLSGINQAGAAEGIAWWAHIGGFVFGVLIAKITGGKQKVENYW